MQCWCLAGKATEGHVCIGCGTPVANNRCASATVLVAASALFTKPPLQALLQRCSILGGKSPCSTQSAMSDQLICLTPQSSLQALLERCSTSDDAIRWARCLSEVLKHAGHMCSASVSSAYIEVCRRLQVSVRLHSQPPQCTLLLGGSICTSASVLRFAANLGGAAVCSATCSTRLLQLLPGKTVAGRQSICLIVGHLS